MTHRGWIALDIDGTITDQPQQVPTAVCSYLKTLVKQGWKLILITGRPFSFGIRALSGFDFPFFFAVQNGADIVSMPIQQGVARHYLTAPIIDAIETIYLEFPEDFVIYSGLAAEDICYYRPKRFSVSLLQHIDTVQRLSGETWKSVDAFPFGNEDSLALIKCFGTEEAMHQISRRLSSMTELASTVIRDPMGIGIYLNLITNARATKGKALMNVINHVGYPGRVIAAGDDRNDISMLQVADVRIVMETAPQEMHGGADIIAQSAAHLGIIAALEEAVLHD